MPWGYLSPAFPLESKARLEQNPISLGRKLELSLFQGSSINYCSHCTTKDQMLWIGFNWLLISYVITYGCAEMLSDVLDAFDYSFWQLGLKTAGRHFLICNGLPWRANKTRWLDEWSCSAHPVLLRCSAILKANTMRASQGKSGKNFKEHEDLVLPEVPCCQHQGRVSQGTGTWAQTKQKCPSVSDPRRGRSDYFCIAGDNPPACQPQG